MAPTGPFPGSFVVVGRSAGDFPLLWVLLGAAGALVGVGVVGWTASRRRSTRSDATH
jgi:hypothetical protein